MERPKRTLLPLVAGSVLAIAMVFGQAGSAHAGGGVAPTKATPAQRELAQSRFLKGRELYNKGKYENALAELSASLDVVASPNTRLVMGRCHRELGRYVAAYAELGRAAIEANELAREDPRYEKTAETALAERAELTPKLGFLQINIANAEPGTTLRVSGEEVRRGGWSEPVPVMPGEAEIVVETPGRPAVRETMPMGAGETRNVSLDAGPPEGAPKPVALPVQHDKPLPLRPLAYAAGGLALVGLGTFLVAGSMANGTYSDLESACGAGPCPRDREEDISSGKTQQTFANLGLGVFVVGAAAGVTLYLLSRRAADRPAATASASSPLTPPKPRLEAPRILAGPTYLGVQGTF